MSELSLDLSYLYLSEAAEPQSTLPRRALLHPPYPDTLHDLLVTSSSFCPIFAHPVDYRTFTIGYTNGVAYTFDSSLLFPRSAICTGSLDIMPTTGVPLFYKVEPDEVCCYRGGANGLAPLAAVPTEPFGPGTIAGEGRGVKEQDVTESRCINALYLDEFFCVFFAAKSRTYGDIARIVCTTVSPGGMFDADERTYELQIRLSAPLVAACIDASCFMLADAGGFVLLGKNAQIFCNEQMVTQLRTKTSRSSAPHKVLPQPARKEAFTCGRLWPQERERRVNAALRTPTKCALNSEIGLCCVASSAGTLHFFDLGLQSVFVNDYRLGLSLDQLLSITPTVFNIFFSSRLLVVVLERAPVLLIALPKWLSASTLFLTRFFGRHPYSARNFVITSPHLIWDVLTRLNVSPLAQAVASQGSRAAQRLAGQEGAQGELDSLWTQAYGRPFEIAPGVSGVAGAAPVVDLEALRMEVLVAILDSELRRSRDETATGILLNACSFLLNQALAVGKIEIAYVLALKLSGRRGAAGRMRTVLAYAIGARCTAIAALARQALQYSVIGQNVEDALSVARSTGGPGAGRSTMASTRGVGGPDPDGALETAIDAILDGDFSRAGRAAKKGGLEGYLDCRGIAEVAEALERDRVHAMESSNRR